MQENITIFVCSTSTPDDQPLQQKIEKLLHVLQRQPYIQLQYEHKFPAGVDLKREIARWLDKADLIFFLVSMDLLDSNYFYALEITHAMQRHRSGTARVTPIILRPCDWKSTDLNDFLPVLPRNKQAITQQDNLEQALVEIVEEIRQEIKHCLLERFHTALNTGMPQRIVEAYIADFIVRRQLESHEQHVLSLAEQFMLAYTQEDDTALANIYQEMYTKYSNMFKLSERELQRCALALKRDAAYQELSNDLRTKKRPEKLLRTYRAYLALVNKVTLTRDEQAQIELAQRYVEAYAARDYTQLYSAYKEMIASPYDKLFQFTQDEREKILRITPASLHQRTRLTTRDICIFADSESGLTPVQAKALDIVLIAPNAPIGKMRASPDSKPGILIQQQQTNMRQAPSFTQALREAYVQAANQGYVGILSLHATTKLSNTHQVAVQTWETLPAIQKKEISSEIIDAQSIAPAISLALESAITEAKRGAGLQEIKARVLAQLAQTYVLITGEGLESLLAQKNQHANPSLLENIWDMKSIFTLKDGRLVLIEKCSTLKKTQERMIQLLHERGKLEKVALAGADEKLTRQLSKSLSTFYTDPIAHYGIGSLFPPDTLALAAIIKK